MNIAVIGAGGVGGYYGGLLAKAGLDIAFVARGRHLVAMRQAGLKLVTPHGDFTVKTKATDDPSELGDVDLFLFCVKSYDTEDAARSIVPAVGPNSTVLTLQNGVDNHERIGAIVGKEKVLPGAAFIFSEIESPGVVKQTGGPRRVIFGELDGTKTERAEAIQNTMKSAGINCDLTDNIQQVLWKKLLWICALAGMNCVTRLPLGPILADPESRAMFRDMMEEVRSLADSMNVRIDPKYVDQQMDFADKLEKASTSSTFRDLESGRRLELEALHGTVVRYGKMRGVATPMNRAVYAALKPHEMGREGQSR